MAACQAIQLHLAVHPAAGVGPARLGTAHTLVQHRLQRRRQQPRGLPVPQLRESSRPPRHARAAPAASSSTEDPRLGGPADSSRRSSTALAAEPSGSSEPDTPEVATAAAAGVTVDVTLDDGDAAAQGEPAAAAAAAAAAPAAVGPLQQQPQQKQEQPQEQKEQPQQEQQEQPQQETETEQPPETPAGSQLLRPRRRSPTFLAASVVLVVLFAIANR